MTVHPSCARKYSVTELSYCLFMASVPLEALGTMYFDLGFSLSLPTGVFFVICYFFLNKRSNILIFPWPMALPLVWIIVASVQYLWADDMQYFEYIIRVFNVLAFSVILYNYIVRNNNIRRGLLVMGGATAIASLGILLGHGYDIFSGGRFSMLDIDENNIGSIFALGALILFMFALEKNRSMQSIAALVGMAVINMAVLISTGSRGAMLAFVLSIIIYFILFFSKKMFKAMSLFILFAIVGASVYFYQKSPATQMRWEITLDRTNPDALGTRDLLFLRSIDMILEKPFFGWGMKDIFSEMGQKIQGGGEMGTHNTYMMILVSSGIIGGIPFMYFYLYPFLNIKKQTDNDTFKKVLVLFSFIMIVFMSLDWLNRKQSWIFYSMLLAIISNSRYSYLKLRMDRIKV